MRKSSDKIEFNVVYKGQWFRLACLSEHLKHKVPQGKALLLDTLCRRQIVPMDEIHIASQC